MISTIKNCKMPLKIYRKNGKFTEKQIYINKMLFGGEPGDYYVVYMASFWQYLKQGVGVFPKDEVIENAFRRQCLGEKIEIIPFKPHKFLFSLNIITLTLVSCVFSLMWTHYIRWPYSWFGSACTGIILGLIWPLTWLPLFRKIVHYMDCLAGISLMNAEFKLLKAKIWKK